MSELQKIVEKIEHHFTASAIVLCRGHVLLVHHRRLGAWVPPGGHVEPDEVPAQTVRREVEEETGLEVEIIQTGLPVSADSRNCFLDQPLYIQRVKAAERGGVFYHIDLAFLCRPASFCPGSGELPGLKANHEVAEARWVRLTELSSLLLADNVAEGVELALKKLEEIEASGMFEVWRGRI